MSYRIRVRPAAEQDIVTALGWYDAHAPGQGGRLLDEVSVVTARIADTPKLYRTVYGEVRRAPLRVFPYFVWFVVDDETTTVHVLAVTHHRRDPEAVRSRLG